MSKVKKSVDPFSGKKFMDAIAKGDFVRLERTVLKEGKSVFSKVRTVLKGEALRNLSTTK